MHPTDKVRYRTNGGKSETHNVIDFATRLPVLKGSKQSREYPEVTPGPTVDYIGISKLRRLYLRMSARRQRVCLHFAEGLADDKDGQQS